MTRLREKGRISEGDFLEFLQSHTNAVFQPNYDDPGFAGFNPYALGFAMMRDLERIVSAPDAEDRAFFPEIAGRGEAMPVLREIWANYRDDSFIGQFLSPRLMRQFRLFHLRDDSDDPEITVDDIHNERGYRAIRRHLARQYEVGRNDPNIEVVDADLAGDRRLIVNHRILNGAELDEEETERTLQHLADLWGYGVVLREIDGDEIIREHAVSARRDIFGG
jgi:spore cortex formation protein SpoVR/YcgB (stage V sporulation)